MVSTQNHDGYDDEVDHLEHGDGEGVAGRVVGETHLHNDDWDGDDDDDDIYIMVKCLYVCNVFAYFCV